MVLIFPLLPGAKRRKLKAPALPIWKSIRDCETGNWWCLEAGALNLEHVQAWLKFSTRFHFRANTKGGRQSRDLWRVGLERFGLPFYGYCFLCLIGWGMGPETWWEMVGERP